MALLSRRSPASSWFWWKSFLAHWLAHSCGRWKDFSMGVIVELYRGGQKVFFSRAGQQWYSAILPIRDYNKNIFSTDNLIRKYQNQGSKFPCHLFRRPFSQMLQVALRCAAKYSHWLRLKTGHLIFPEPLGRPRQDQALKLYKWPPPVTPA